MLARLDAMWEQIVSGLWLIPTLMAFGAVGLAWLTPNLTLDPPTWWLSSGDRESVSQFISSLLMSMITLATLAISITMIVLTLAAEHMGPRLIRNFMADKRSQLMLGFFLATVIYLILALRAVQNAGEGERFHHLAATISMLLSIGSVFLLLLFVHHLSRSIVTDTLIQRIGRNLYLTLEEALPAERDEETQEQEARLPEEEGAMLRLAKGGYVQAIDFEQLKQRATEADVLLYLEFHPGQFLLPQGDHGRIFPACRSTDRLLEQIQDCVTLGGQRTPHQDLEFAVRQLVELALRGLSPAINDPFTAIAVIDHLSLFLAEVMRREPPRFLWHDDAGKPRVIANRTTFRGLVDAAFNQIRQAGQRPDILIHMMEALTHLTEQIRKPEHRDVLRDHVELVLGNGQRSIGDSYDLEPLMLRAEEALRHLEVPSPAISPLLKQR